MNEKHITITDEGERDKETPVELNDQLKEEINNSLKHSIPSNQRNSSVPKKSAAKIPGDYKNKH